MFKQLLILSFISLALISCNKEEIYNVIPRCINDLITEFKKSASCDDSKVEQYLFQNQVVFVFKPGSCGADMQSEVFDMNCTILGSLGGITGNTEINKEDFANAVFIKTVYPNQ